MASSAVVATGLVALCRGRVPDLPDDPAVVDEFVAAVRRHRLAPLAHVRLREARPEVAQRLARDREVAMAVHLRASVVLADLGRAVGDIPWASFKGPVLSEFAHPVPGLRSYGDVDVLVAPEDLREVATLLEAVGWSTGDHEGHQRNPDTPGEMHWRTPSGLLVDMHWSMINMASVRRRFDVPTRGLLARRRIVRLGLADVPVLDPVDAFVHVCVHAGLTGAHRMLWLLDVDQAARRVDDWEPVLARARDWRVEAPVALVLRRASHVLGTPVPVRACERLGVSPVSRRIMDLTDRWSPVPSLEREASLAKSVSRGIRPGGARTVGVMGQKVVQGVWDRRPGRAPVREPDLSAVADRPARESYLARVEAEAGRREGP